MKHILASLVLVMLWTGFATASHPTDLSSAQSMDPASGTVVSTPEALFRQHIPFVAEQFAGMPFKLGGNPMHTGTTDNASLFFSIFATAAQKAGLVYKTYLPVCYLLENAVTVQEHEVQNGDLMVLEDGLAAMVYKKDPSGRLYLIYASEKRQQVTSFHSENLVYQAFWQEHLKGFYRLKPEMLMPAKHSGASNPNPSSDQ